MAFTLALAFTEKLTPHLAELVLEDPDGPIARQFLRSAAEDISDPRDRLDPIGDAPHSPVKGIVHREPDRVLLKPIHTCAAYCRFCFRKDQLDQQDSALSPEELEAAIAYIAAHPGIWEVILTGGDPLVLSPRRLEDIITRLSAIPHLGVIRFHTRQPVVDPESITPELIAALKGAAGKAVWGAVHCNHEDELTLATRAALARLVDAGIPLVAQTVLLKGINDTPSMLESLFRRLIENRVKPYYLHHGDLAPGTAHFRTTIVEGQGLMRSLLGKLSGLAMPVYVLDIPGGAGKVPVGPVYLEGNTVTDPRGKKHFY